MFTPKFTPKKKEILNSMGIYDGMDLLFHYPFRYELIECKNFDKWQVGDKVVFEGKIISQPRTHRFGRNRSVTSFSVLTDYDVFQVSIFNRPWFKQSDEEKTITIFGKYDGGRKVTAMQTNFQPLSEQLGIKPVYSLKDGITSKYFDSLIQESWDMNSEYIENFIPELLIDRYNYLTRKDALYSLHFSDDFEMIKGAIRTMKYEEFLRFQLVMQTRKSQNKTIEQGSKKIFDKNIISRFIKELPYELTDDQHLAIEDVLNDLSSDSMMYRMLQGDVGCGKTIVATISMYATVLAGYQAAIMVPTEILAKQHYQNINKMFGMLGIRVALLTSSISKSDKDDIHERISNGEIDMVVGTHALFQQSVSFPKLGMVVTDEQQRFGVAQRKSFVQKGNKVDVLMMSATPIPRTLATSLYGDMDVSTIKQMPKGRKLIETKLINENSIRLFKEDVEKLMNEGNQIYMVCAAIEKNDEFIARNAQELYTNLSKEWAGKYNVGIVHGKLKTDEKDEVMNDFLAKKYDVLVTTTVVEVGVDIKDANVMIIYDAHRFGLSQLHQLRGRVGRSDKQGYCYLLTNSKDVDSLKRLEVLVNNQDGFDISMEDLKIRGPGDLLGTRQSGIPGFILGDILVDSDILEQSKVDALDILENIHEFPTIERYLLENEKKHSDYLD